MTSFLLQPVPVVPRHDGQDGDQGQAGAEQDPAPDIQNGVLASPHEGPELFLFFLSSKFKHS